MAHRTARRLALHKHKKVVHGVGGGLGEWLGINAWIIRAAGVVYFVIALYWYGLLAAIAAWVVTYAIMWAVLRGVPHHAGGLGEKR